MLYEASVVNMLSRVGILTGHIFSSVVCKSRGRTASTAVEELLCLLKLSESELSDGSGCFVLGPGIFKSWSHFTEPGFWLHVQTEL